MYAKEKTVEKSVCSRVTERVCTAVELKTARSNAEEEPVNIAYGLYVLVHLRRYIQIRIYTDHDEDDTDDGSTCIESIEYDTASRCASCEPQWRAGPRSGGATARAIPHL